jgi:aspartyl-tRNA(Asn)/glutamyl-tRNA(Gln) amidotransferase subunit B
MGGIANLTTILEQEVAWYANARSWKARLHYIEDEKHQIFTVIALPDKDHPSVKSPHITVMTRIVGDTVVIDEDKTDRPLYEAVLAAGANPKSAANWMTTSLFSVMNNAGIERELIGQTKISAGQFAALVKLVDGGAINKGTVVEILAEMWETGADPARIVAEKGLAQVSDTSAIAEVVAKVLDDNAAVVARYLSGEEKVFGALMGQCMKALKGKGNPAVVTEILKQQIEKRR